MALTTYGELLTSLEGWLNRTDLTATQTPDFIRLFESRANRLLRMPQMEATATNVGAVAAVALPTDYLQLRTVKIATKPLKGYSPQEVLSVYATGTAAAGGGTPTGYSVEGTTLILAPAPSASVTVEIDYFKSIPALTTTNTTNWLLTNYPDAYLAGTLAVAYAFLRDDNAAAQRKANWDEVLAEMTLDAERRRTPAGPLVARVRTYD